MLDALTAWIVAHPELVTTVLGAVFVHLRALVPTGKPNTVWGFVTGVWDTLAGNYGHAANQPPKE
jgi:hypothetical protein